MYSNAVVQKSPVNTTPTSWHYGLESNWTFIYISSKPTCDKPKAEGRRPEGERSERASEASSTQAKCTHPELVTCRRPLHVPVPEWTTPEVYWIYEQAKRTEMEFYTPLWIHKAEFINNRHPWKRTSSIAFIIKESWLILINCGSISVESCRHF